jgi:hypothetical protein
MNATPDKVPARPPSRESTSDYEPHKSRASRLEAIRQMLDSGCYEIPAALVAERMINSALSRRRNTSADRRF